MHNIIKGALLALLAGVVYRPIPCYIFIGEYDFPEE